MENKMGKARVAMKTERTKSGGDCSTSGEDGSAWKLRRAGNYTESSARILMI
jgi:hypothetical protein